MASFEEQLTELEKVVDQLERGDLTLEENVQLFERGVTLSNACKTQLASAESRIQVLLHPQREGAVQVEELGMAVADGEDFVGDEMEDRKDEE